MPAVRTYRPTADSFEHSPHMERSLPDRCLLAKKRGADGGQDRTEQIERCGMNG